MYISSDKLQKKKNGKCEKRDRAWVAGLTMGNFKEARCQSLEDVFGKSRPEAHKEAHVRMNTKHTRTLLEVSSSVHIHTGVRVNPTHPILAANR